MKTFSRVILITLLLNSIIFLSEADDSIDARKGCNDEKGDFWILTGFHAGTKQNCKWGGEKKFRCNNVEEVRANCPKTCDTCGTEAPTAAPTQTPTMAPTKKECKNASESFPAPSIKWIKHPVDCQWASYKREKRCKYKDIEKNCPVLCGSCCSDSESKFHINVEGGTINRNCDWVRRRDTHWRCKTHTEAIDNCPLTCGQCLKAPSQMPSQPLTHPPSKAPTKKPTKKKATKVPTKAPSFSPTSVMPTSCFDEPGWTTFDKDGDFSGKTCANIAESPKVWCSFLVKYANAGKTTFQACCVCGKADGSLAPSTMPTTNPSAYPSITPSPTALTSETPSSAPSQCVDDPDYIWERSLNYSCAQLTKSFCISLKDRWVNGKNSYRSCCICGGGSHIPTVPSSSPSVSMSPTLSASPTIVVSMKPSLAPSSPPTQSAKPSFFPTAFPTITPTETPTIYGTSSPSYLPSSVPTKPPTGKPSYFPSATPTARPSLSPTLKFSDVPSLPPSAHPSSAPSKLASSNPSASPSQCVDEKDWIATSSEPVLENFQSSCKDINESTNPALWCNMFDLKYKGKFIDQACCICGGGYHIRVVSSPAPSPVNQNSNIRTPTKPVVNRACVDEPNWLWKDPYDCSDLTKSFCDGFTNVYINGKNAQAACCNCGGGTHMSKNQE